VRMRKLSAAIVAVLIHRGVGSLHRLALGAVVLGAFGLVYGALTLALRIPEARALVNRVSTRR
jgi:hypothetical protein